MSGILALGIMPLQEQSDSPVISISNLWEVLGPFQIGTRGRSAFKVPVEL